MTKEDGDGKPGAEVVPLHPDPEHAPGVLPGCPGGRRRA